MKISDALRGVTLLGLDTAPFIYFVEKHPTYFDKVELIFKQIDKGILSGVSSTLTLTEVLSHPLKLGKSTLVQHYETILLNSNGFRDTLILVDWERDGVFGISVITAENEWDRMFTYYSDIEFQTYNEAYKYVLELIEARIK